RDPLRQRPDLLPPVDARARSPPFLRQPHQIGIPGPRPARIPGLLPGGKPVRAGAGRRQPVPQAPMTTVQRAARPTGTNHDAPVSILVVDDDTNKRFALKTILAPLGETIV